MNIQVTEQIKRLRWWGPIEFITPPNPEAEYVKLDADGDKPQKPVRSTEDKGGLGSRVLTANELEDLPAPIWLIDGVLQQGALAELFGPPKQGKSFIAQYLAFAVASGVPWFGRAVQCGPVIYVATEGLDALKSRMATWQAAHKAASLGLLYIVWGPVNLLNHA